jgi:large subunit ribosomal protein L3
VARAAAFLWFFTAMNTVLGIKKTVTQKFLEDGTRIPVTFVAVTANPVMAIKTIEKHGYNAVQLGWFDKTKTEKTDTTQGTKKKLAPRFLKEVRLESTAKLDTLPKVGEIIDIATVLQPGDVIDVTGISKGKGFAGGVKRFHFKGGPRTHGQSDRERAPGSIGQTTTPGRVYKGKRMAGKMGHETVTVKNLMIVDVTPENVLVKGVVPGIPNSLLVIKKVGEKKKFVPMLREGAQETNETRETEVVKEAPVVEPVVTTAN